MTIFMFHIFVHFDEIFLIYDVFNLDLMITVSQFLPYQIPTLSYKTTI